MAIANPQHEQVPDGVTYLEEVSGQESVKMWLDVSLYPVRKSFEIEIGLSEINARV